MGSHVWILHPLFNTSMVRLDYMFFSQQKTKLQPSSMQSCRPTDRLLIQTNPLTVVWLQAGCRWPCWSRCYTNMHLMTCRPRGSCVIMANKTDLEYIMFPVNLMPRHQRPERAVIKVVSKKKKDLVLDMQKCVSETSRFDVRSEQRWPPGALISFVVFAGFTWSPRSRRPCRTSWSQGEYRRMVLMVTIALWILSTWTVSVQVLSRDLLFSGPSRKGRTGRTQRPCGAHGKTFNALTHVTIKQ